MTTVAEMIEWMEEAKQHHELMEKFAELIAKECAQYKEPK
jgi:hypothetical protein